MREFCFSNCCYLSVAALVLTFQLRRMAMGFQAQLALALQRLLGPRHAGPLLDERVLLELLLPDCCRLGPDFPAAAATLGLMTLIVVICPWLPGPIGTACSA